MNLSIVKIVEMGLVVIFGTLHDTDMLTVQFSLTLAHQKEKKHIARCASSLFADSFTESAWHLQYVANARVRIPHPKIGVLAHLAQGVGIFANGEIPVIQKLLKHLE